MPDLGFNLLTLFTFFYAIFWASTLEFNSKYQPFNPIGFFSKKLEAKKIRRRFYLSVLLLDVIPVFYFAATFFLLTHFLDINDLRWWNLILTGITALSAFGFTRIFPALIACDKTCRFFYPHENMPNISSLKEENAFIAYLVSGIIYLVIPFVTISIMYLLQHIT